MFDRFSDKSSRSLINKRFLYLIFLKKHLDFIVFANNFYVDYFFTFRTVFYWFSNLKNYKYDTYISGRNDILRE